VSLSLRSGERLTIGVKLDIIKCTEETANVMVGLSDYCPDNAEEHHKNEIKSKF
jgi:uncharacterized short protein YbdD (DUF466 family)